MAFNGSSEEARKKMQKLLDKEQKLKADIDAAKEQLREAEELEEAALNLGLRLLKKVDIINLDGFVRYIETSADKISCIRLKSSEAKEKVSDKDFTNDSKSANISTQKVS